MSEIFIKQIKEKDEAGIDTLKSRYHSRIKYIVSGILKNQNDIDECINDIYFTVWNKIELYDETKSSFATWITVVSHNKAINHLKKLSLTEFSIDGVKTIYSPSFEAEVERKEILLNVSAFVRTLPNFERNLFYRKFFYLQSISQIAAETGRTERSIEGNLYRLRKKLQKEFGGDIL